MSRPHYVQANMPRKERVEALSDGIFSVAMTLLVLDIKLPEGVRFASNADAVRHFASVGEAIGTYVVSFFVLAMFWVGHNYQFRYVERLVATACPLAQVSGADHACDSKGTEHASHYRHHRHRRFHCVQAEA